MALIEPPKIISYTSLNNAKREIDDKQDGSGEILFFISAFIDLRTKILISI